MCLGGRILGRRESEARRSNMAVFVRLIADVVAVKTLRRFVMYSTHSRTVPCKVYENNNYLFCIDISPLIRRRW